MNNNLIELLEKHEGFRAKPYLCTANKLTIGIGRNLEDKGITYAEAKVMLENDINYLSLKLEDYDWYQKHTQVRKDVLLNMAFNLGVAGLMKFARMLGALRSKDYRRASREMLDSLWAKQVPNRAKELAAMMTTGKYQE